MAAKKITVQLVDQCANGLCSNVALNGQFAVVTISTAANVGGGSGLIQLTMCSPCADAIAASDVQPAESSDKRPTIDAGHQAQPAATGGADIDF